MSISTSLNSQLEQFFRQHPDEWIDGRKLETIAGRYAWRTRVSDLRILRDMTIENRLRREREHAIGCPALQAWDISEACHCDRPRRYTVSEYRYVPRPEAHPE